MVEAAEFDNQYKRGLHTADRQILASIDRPGLQCLAFLTVYSGVSFKFSRLVFGQFHIDHLFRR